MIYGIGINDAPYKVRPRNGIACPYYKVWKAMMMRCYSKTYAARQSYKGTVVCNEWLSFMVFKGWMEEQEWEGMELDKDILGDGSLYSPETCAFIPRQLNKAFALPEERSELPYGVYKVERDYGTRYEAKIKIDNRSVFLGIHTSVQSAANAWCQWKSRMIREQLDAYKLCPGYREDVYWCAVSKIPHIVVED